MKIAITGGAGFIGSALARLLKQDGHDLVLADLKPSEEFPAASRIIDVTDAAALSEALKGVDAIYHLAAEHRDDVRPAQKYYDVNVGGARNVADAARQHGIRTIIFTSSVALYGLDCGESEESNAPRPFNDYGRSKLESEHVFEEWAKEAPDRHLVTVRLVATFGPGNRGNIHTLMDQIARGKFFMVGRGENRKSIACVENVAAFLKYGLMLPPGSHLYNYADKPDLPTRTLVGLIRESLGLKGLGPRAPYILGLAGGLAFDVLARVTGRTFPVSAVRVRKFCADTTVSADKLRETGFAAPFSLENGLRDMIEREFGNG